MPIAMPRVFTMSRKTVEMESFERRFLKDHFAFVVPEALKSLFWPMERVCAMWDQPGAQDGRFDVLVWGG